MLHNSQWGVKVQLKEDKQVHFFLFNEDTIIRLQGLIRMFNQYLIISL